MMSLKCHFSQLISATVVKIYLRNFQKPENSKKTYYIGEVMKFSRNIKLGRSLSFKVYGDLMDKFQCCSNLKLLSPVKRIKR